VADLGTDRQIDWSRLRLGYNAAAAGAGAFITPAPLALLHIAGDEYGFALALIGLAAWIDHRCGRLATRALVYATLIATCCTPAAPQLLTYLTGVTP
jgi:hypothetical protein